MERKVRTQDSLERNSQEQIETYMERLLQIFVEGDMGADSALREYSLVLGRLFNKVPELVDRLKEVEPSSAYPIIEDPASNPLAQKINEPQSSYLGRLHSGFLETPSIKTALQEKSELVGCLFFQIPLAIEVIKASNAKNKS
ncbi:MAG: hypothetical protein HY425_02420 [Candidatus Levybacteria bacterium]|nr:hypothetical protein [Candidatus Levybacteria bacterium]